MRKQLVALIPILILSSLLLIDCVTVKNIGVIDFNEYAIGTKVEPKCKMTAASYRYLERTTGSYLDAKTNFTYKVTLDSQIDLNERKTSYTANQLAMALHSVYLASKNLYEDKSIQNRLQQDLLHAHFIVAKDKQNFDYLWVDPNTSIHYLAKMTGVENTCFQTPDGAMFTVVVMPQYFSSNDSYAIIHEIMHWASRSIYNDYDLKHENPYIWSQVITPIVTPHMSLLRTSQFYFDKLTGKS